MRLYIKYDNEEIRKKAELRKAYDSDAGLDLYNASGKMLMVAPYKHLMIPSGISIKLPENTCALIYPRSSTFVKRGLFIVNGLIDSGFTGPLFVIAWHPCLCGTEGIHPIFIQPWERIGQLIVLPIPSFFNIQVVDELPPTDRGKSGFGSTGL